MNHNNEHNIIIDNTQKIQLWHWRWWAYHVFTGNTNGGQIEDYNEEDNNEKDDDAYFNDNYDVD